MDMRNLQGSGTQDWSESLYYHIAKDALARAKEAFNIPPGNKAEWERKKAVATVIVFSALCLEGFINKQYFLLGQTLIKSTSHRDRWINLPKRIDKSNQTFDRSSDLFRTFVQLIAFRNQRLVHFTPENEGSGSVSPPPREWAEEIGDVTLAEKYFNSVTEMVEELRRLTQGKTQDAANSIHNEYVRDVWASVIVSVEVS